MKGYSIGIDIGGTFTDLVYYGGEDGGLRAFKVPSTPKNFIDGVMEGLERSGIPPEELMTFKHGSTIATNAIIERRPSPTGLLTTRGMRAILEAARANRADVADLAWAPAPPLVPRRHILTVAERVDYEGRVLEPLDEEEVRRAGRIFRRRGMKAVAICFLNSFMNPAHERRAKELLEEECPGAFICSSYEVLAEMREFERTSTTVANAYLGPVIESYITELKERAAKWGYRRELFVIHSGGGLMAADAAQRLPARICQSGPAGGVKGAALIGRAAGFRNLITLDMGGTSADLSLIWQGEPLMTNIYSVEFNIPIALPAIDVKAIGAGGGSIAWIDPGGILKSGPQSAGAEPGPACYGQGGEEPTNTDANLLLGRLNPETFLGGEKKIYEELSRKAVEKIGRFFKMSIEEAAAGILRVANANMVNGIRLISVQRGYDPRDFTLLAYGGAGPLHAVDLARELNIPRVLVPRLPGVTSAIGVLATDLRYDFLTSILQKEKELDLERLNRAYEEMEEEALATLSRAGTSREEVELERQADIRYFGKTAYLTISVPSAKLTREAVKRMFEFFNEEHRRQYGYVASDVGEFEVANARLRALGKREALPPARARGRGKAEDALKGSRKVYFPEGGGWLKSNIYDREKLLLGAELSGPAIVEQADATTVIPPGARARVDEHLNLVIDLR